MHESYDEDDDYDDDQYDYDHPSDNPYQWYYQFDISPDTPVSHWISEMLNKWISQDAFKNLSGGWEFLSIPGFSTQKFPVNSWSPDTAKHKSFQYLGSNYDGYQIWKTKYFLIDQINIEYKLHLSHNAKYFLREPHYYMGLFDILN